MLVLALQFSKGVHQAGDDWHIVIHRGSGAAPVGSRRSCRGDEGDSLKTEEKTKSIISAQEEDGSYDSRFDLTDPPVHQLGTGSHRAGRLPTIDGTVAP